METKNPKPKKSSKLFTVFNPILSFFNPGYRKTKLMDLPRAIMMEILSRLPIKSMLRVRHVCKLWYNLFSDPLFLTIYKSRSPPPCILLSRDHSINRLLELEGNCTYYSYRPIVMNGPKFNPMFRLIGSCNGFIGLITNMCDINTSVYIGNPLLGEYYNLKLHKLEKSVCRVVYGFCFSEVSARYKLVRSVTRKFEGHPELSELEVYTLGVDEKWRSLGQIPYPVWHDFGQVCVNGALHWMSTPVKKDSIYSFDIGTEKVKSVPGPPGLEFPSAHLTQVELGIGPTSCLTLVELENCLCLSDDRCTFGHIDIWWMKEYGIAESWTKDRIFINCCRPSGFGNGIHYHKFLPLLTWKDGEILMQGKRDSQLCSYNPKEKMFMGLPFGRDIATVATRYIPSFYSLKTIMGDNFKSQMYIRTKSEIV